MSLPSLRRWGDRGAGKSDLLGQLTWGDDAWERDKENCGRKKIKNEKNKALAGKKRVFGGKSHRVHYEGNKGKIQLDLQRRRQCSCPDVPLLGRFSAPTV